METFIETISKLSPLGVIAILAIIIYQLVKNGNVISLLRGTQVNDRQIVETKVGTDAIDLATLNIKLDALANNHLHQLPEMKLTLDAIAKEQVAQGNRLVRVETILQVRNEIK